MCSGERGVGKGKGSRSLYVSLLVVLSVPFDSFHLFFHLVDPNCPSQESESEEVEETGSQVVPESATSGSSAQACNMHINVRADMLTLPQ